MSNLTASLTVKLIDDVSKPARSVAQALQDAGKQAQAVAKAMAGNGSTDRLNASLGKLKLGAKDIEQVSKAWRDYASTTKLAANASDWTKSQASDVRRWESQTIAALKAVQKEEAAFSRAQKKAMEQPATHGHGPSQWGHGGAAGFVAQGAAGAVSAHSVYHASKSALEQGSEYQHERVALMNAGRTADLKRMEEAARQTAMALPTANYAETLKAINETTSSFGSIDHAIENIGFVMKTAAVLKAAAGDKIGGDAGSMGQQYAKFFEMRGTAGNPEKFREEGNQMTRAMIATRGNFNPQEMYNFASQAKGALRLYDIDYLSKMIPSIVGEVGGDRAGTAANAFKNTIMGKARDKKQLAAWEKYHLIDPKMVSDKKDSWTPGAVYDTDLALRNPLKYFEQRVLPNLKAGGVNINDPLELSKVLGVLYRNNMANQFAEENSQLADRTRLHKDAAIIEKTDTPDNIYKRNLGEDARVAIDALTESLKNLGTAASSPVMATAASTISSVAQWVQQLAAWGKEHPVAAVTTGGAAAAGGMAGAGYLSWQFLNGFGLKSAGASLQVAATMLQGAAGKQAIGTGGVVGNVAKGAGFVAGAVEAAPIIAGAIAQAGLLYGAVKYKEANPTEFRGGAHAQTAYKKIDADKEAADRGHWEETPSRSRYGGGGRHWVEDVKAKADAAKVSIEGLNTTVAPHVDNAALIQTLAIATRLQGVLQSISGAANGAAAAVRGINVPSLGATQRGHFTAGGVQGE